MTLDPDTVAPPQPKKMQKLRKSILLFGVLPASLCMCVLLFAAQILRRYDIWGAEGPYAIEQVVLTDEIKDGKPGQEINKFTPTQLIACWVSTRGAEGLIGFRWYYGDELIFEIFEKTRENQIYSYIQSSPTRTLQEGDYRVEVHTTGGTPRETLHFTIEQYQPKVNPPQIPPPKHIDIESSPFVEVPFAFDEVWTIDNTNWKINEVKVTFLDNDAVFVAVVIETDLDVSNLSEKQADILSKPIALYAIENGYLQQARAIEIDGNRYPLDEAIYINLINPSANTSQKSGYRVGFDLKNLTEILDEK